MSGGIKLFLPCRQWRRNHSQWWETRYTAGFGCWETGCFVSESRSKENKENHCLCWAHVGRETICTARLFGASSSSTICFWGVTLKKKAHHFLINSLVALSIPSSCVIFYAFIYMEYYCIPAVNLWGRNLLRSLTFSRQLTDTLHTRQFRGYELNSAGSTHCWLRACPLWLKHYAFIVEGCWRYL